MKGINWLKRALTHPALGLLLRVYLGGVFVYASMYKINYPPEFAETVASYQLIPVWAVHLTALVMPWTELLCGVLLILGLRTKTSAALIGAMLFIFGIAIVAALVRDLPIGCGCFTSVEEPLGWQTLARDLMWLAMAVHVYCFPSALQLEERLLMSLKGIDG